MNESFFASGRSFTLAAAAIALVAASALIFFVFRSIFGRRLRLSRNGRTRPVRLGIVDAFDLDRERQLVIVRRDNVEHLLMIGGRNDLVVESQFMRSEGRESRSYREAKFRDKEFRETPLVPPAQADLPISSGHKVASSRAAGAELESLPSELLEGVQQKSEPVLRTDARQNKVLAQADDAWKSLALEEAVPARRGPLDPLSGQRTPIKRGSAPLPDDPPKKPESTTNSAARALRAPVTTPFLRPSTRLQAQDTACQSASSRAREPRPDGLTIIATSKGPKAFAGSPNADTAAAPVALQARTDAAAPGSSGPVTTPPEKGRPQRADPLELEMARLLGRKPEVEA